MGEEGGGYTGEVGESVLGSGVIIVNFSRDQEARYVSDSRVGMHWTRTALLI